MPDRISRHYVPVLRWKRGEGRALEQLTPAVRREITPLVEIPAVPWDFVNDLPGTSLEDHLTKAAALLEKSWSARTAVIDLKLIGPDERMADGRHPITFIHELLDPLGAGIPATSPGRDAAQKEAVAEVCARDGHGVCVRCTAEDFLTRGFRRKTDEVLAAVRQRRREADLVLDLGSLLVGGIPQFLQTNVQDFLANEDLSGWRTVILAATSFPKDLSAIKADTVGEIVRHEWALWDALRRDASIARVPVFGDYAIANPDSEERDPRIMKVSASIRYTRDTRWFIYRGRNVTDHGFEQYTDLAKQLASNRRVFMGPRFSAGDQFIYDCASEEEGTGNHETWRRVGTNHHITFVAHQLARLSEDES